MDKWINGLVDWWIGETDRNEKSSKTMNRSFFSRTRTRVLGEKPTSSNFGETFSEHRNDRTFRFCWSLSPEMKIGKLDFWRKEDLWLKEKLRWVSRKFSSASRQEIKRIGETIFCQESRWKLVDFVGRRICFRRVGATPVSIWNERVKN